MSKDPKRLPGWASTIPNLPISSECVFIGRQTVRSRGLFNWCGHCGFSGRAVVSPEDGTTRLGFGVDAGDRLKILNHSALLAELREVLDNLVGKACWNIAAGINTGSHVSFDFGKKVRRVKPLKNPRISQELRQYTGEVSLFVTCSWRLDSEVEVLCGSEDDNSEEGPMLHG